MKLLFVTIGLPDLGSSSGSFYGDMIKALRGEGHDVTAIAPSFANQKTGLYYEDSIRVLRVKSPSMGGGIFSKGLTSIMLPRLYRWAYSKCIKEEKFDWILLPTPPPTLVYFVKSIKRSSNAKLYLILRDIQPECANRTYVSPDVIWREDVLPECKRPYNINKIAEQLLFSKSQQLYKTSNLIGCMSPGNVTFLRSIAPYLSMSQLKILPNWYSGDVQVPGSPQQEKEIKAKYKLENKTIAIYGGVLGAPQAVWNIAMLAKHFENDKKLVFLIIGRGEGMQELKKIAKREIITNIQFVDFMPRDEYETILTISDIGLISLDEKYKVPTCPSKIVGYMAMSKPVLAMINRGSDYGEFYIDKPGCGLYSVGLDTEKMYNNMQWLIDHPIERKNMGRAGYDYYIQHFTVEKVCESLIKQMKNE